MNKYTWQLAKGFYTNRNDVRKPWIVMEWQWNMHIVLKKEIADVMVVLIFDFCYLFVAF